MAHLPWLLGMTMLPICSLTLLSILAHTQRMAITHCCREELWPANKYNTFVWAMSPLVLSYTSDSSRLWMPCRSRLAHLAEVDQGFGLICTVLKHPRPQAVKPSSGL